MKGVENDTRKYVYVLSLLHGHQYGVDDGILLLRSALTGVDSSSAQSLHSLDQGAVQPLDVLLFWALQNFHRRILCSPVHRASLDAVTPAPASAFST